MPVLDCHPYIYTESDPHPDSVTDSEYIYLDCDHYVKQYSDNPSILDAYLYDYLWRSDDNIFIDTNVHFVSDIHTFTDGGNYNSNKLPDNHDNQYINRNGNANRNFTKSIKHCYCYPNVNPHSHRNTDPYTKLNHGTLGTLYE